MKKIGILLLIIILSGCDISKRATKGKTQSSTQNDIVRESTKVTQEKRDGGKLTTGIIPIEERERDDNGHIKELIQTLKDGALTKTIYYKPDGSVDVDCTADEIWIRIEEKLNERDKSIVDEEIKEKTSEKEENFDSSVILYGFIGLGALMSIIAIIGFFYLKSIKPL